MKEIKSIEQYITAIMKMKKEQDDKKLFAYQWFFRGQKDSSWSIIPNAFRGDKIQNEYSVIQNAIRQNPFEFHSLTEFDILTKLQHYGLGTRLLDVTLNPLVALYFATEPAVTYEYIEDKRSLKNNRYEQVEKDGAIYYNYVPWHSVNELGVRIAMNIPFLDITDNFTVGKLLSYFHESNIISDADFALLQEDDYKLFIEYIQENYFIVSTHSNERLTRQSGAFVLPTAIRIKDENTALKNKHLEKAYQDLTQEFDGECFIIPSESKEQIREELDFFNINEATLFPELEHQMLYIQNKSGITSGKVPIFQIYDAKGTESGAKLKYNMEQPDVRAVIEAVIPDTPAVIKNDIIDTVIKETEYIDWKNKTQVRSRIRLYISRKLQSNYSALQSKEFANRILELLLNPTKEYAKGE